MDNREAIQLLDELLLKGDFTDQTGDMDDSSPYEEAVEIARQAIEKQIPQEPLGGSDYSGNDYMICRNCSAIVEDGDWRAAYCPDCGQALDWSSENE